MKKVLLSIICLASGLMSLSLIGEPDFEFGARIMTIFVGLLFVVSAIIFYTQGRVELEESIDQLRQWLTLSFNGQKDTPLEEKTSSFLYEYQQYFANKHHKLTNLLSTKYFATLQLYHNRLDQLHIERQFSCKKMKYSNLPSTRELVEEKSKQYRLYQQDISSVDDFYYNQQKIYSDKNNQLAFYRINSENKLIDGFGFMDSYEVQYEKYRQIRNKMNGWVIAVVGVLSLLLCAVMSLYAGFKLLKEGEMNFLSMICACVLGTVFVTGSFTFLGVVFFDVAIFPFIQIFASASYLSKKGLKALQKRRDKDKQMEKLVQSYDKQFSLEQLYFEIQNDLDCLHYANSDIQLGFSQVDLSELIENYQDIFSISYQKMTLDHYDQLDGMQMITVSVTMSLAALENEKCVYKKEDITLKLEKPVLYSESDYWSITECY